MKYVYYVYFILLAFSLTLCLSYRRCRTLQVCLCVCLLVSSTVVCDSVQFAWQFSQTQTFTHTVAQSTMEYWLSANSSRQRPQKHSLEIETMCLIRFPLFPSLFALSICQQLFFINSLVFLEFRRIFYIGFWAHSFSSNDLFILEAFAQCIFWQFFDRANCEKMNRKKNESWFWRNFT